MCHYVSLCIIMYHYVSVCIILYHYVSLCIILYHYVSVCTSMYHYVSLYIIVYHCITLYIIVLSAEGIQKWKSHSLTEGRRWIRDVTKEHVAQSEKKTARSALQNRFTRRNKFWSVDPEQARVTGWCNLNKPIYSLNFILNAAIRDAVISRG